MKELKTDKKAIKDLLDLNQDSVEIMVLEEKGENTMTRIMNHMIMKESIWGKIIEKFCPEEPGEGIYFDPFEKKFYIKYGEAGEQEFIDKNEGKWSKELEKRAVALAKIK